jgi:hypothetical protein
MNPIERHQSWLERLKAWWGKFKEDRKNFTPMGDDLYN